MPTLTRFRFKLSTLLAMVGLFAIGFVGLRHWMESRPLSWARYSARALNQELRGDAPVIVLVGAKWDVNSKIVERITFEDPTLKSLIRARSAKLFYAECTINGPSDVRSFLKRIDRRSTPHVVVYPEGSADSPVVLDYLMTAEQIISAIEMEPLSEATLKADNQALDRSDA